MSLSIPRKKPRLRILLLGNLLVFTAVFATAEIIARVVVWTWQIPTTFESHPFQGFGETDPIVWWKLRPNLDERMAGVRLRTSALGFRDDRSALPSDATRIFCLGDSSTFGWGIDSMRMYTSVAQTLLASQGHPKAAVISTGVPGYTSYQCLQQFREQIAPLRPNWIVVMASNNECRSRNLGDRDRGVMLARKQRLQRWLGFSQLWLLFSRAPEALSRSWDLDPKPGRVANTCDEYVQNLRELIHDARAKKCGVIVMNMPLRLRSVPIWKHFDDPSPEVTRLLKRADEARRSGAPAGEQIALLDEAARLQPHQFEANWQLAWLELRRDRTEEAERRFLMAREGDLHPETAKPSYNRALEILCAEEDVPFIDLDRLFRESGLGEDVLFLDHCHPSTPGHALIGEALARRLKTLLTNRAEVPAG